MSEPVAVVTLTNPGHPREVKGKYSAKRTVMIDREWTVEVDGVLVGHIRYHMVTHERRSKGKMYVDSRWQSPGWGWREVGGRYWFHPHSKKDAIRSLLWQAR